MSRELSVTQYKEPEVSDEEMKDREIHREICRPLQGKRGSIVKYSRVKIASNSNNTPGSQYEQSKKISRVSRRLEKNSADISDYKRERRI